VEKNHYIIPARSSAGKKPDFNPIAMLATGSVCSLIFYIFRFGAKNYEVADRQPIKRRPQKRGFLWEKPEE
jgi:hypothetical protein